jgi:glycosyltransferase involved in cell wall biosynthesis
MTLKNAPICFVGPLPPPVHGFSEINRRMVLALRNQHEVIAFDMAPGAKPLSFVCAWIRFLFCALRCKPKALYLALSGGHRQWIDIAFVLVARLRSVPLFVHHHSFSYLNERRLSAIVLFRALRGATHLVLCGGMGEQLAKQYGIQHSNVRVLSNAAFLEDIEFPTHVHSAAKPLRVGFLSNITAEKGIFEFFAVLRESAAAGLALQGVIAGPVDPSIKDSFNASLVGSPCVRHVGAVYGADKSSFFAGIDVMFFPTRYPNEAEPVTILEALGHGVPVVAFARGCIAGMIPAAAGTVFPYSAGFAKQTIAALRPLAESPTQLVNARLSARAAFETKRSSNLAVLEALVAEMGGSVMPQSRPA